MFTIRVIDQASPHLARVKKLWRAHSDTLGFFPIGAFTDYAVRKRILVAIASQSRQCVGYLLYRVSRNRATIVHLCVDPEWRKHGVARQLVDHLFAITRDLQGIALKCRRDYPAARAWPRMNFVAQHDKPGRSHDRKELTLWWRDQQHPNLFTQLHDHDALARVPAAIDMNILIDLHHESPSSAEESKCLLADWLSDIELCRTGEMLNEIARIKDSEVRQRVRESALTYRQISASQDDMTRLQEELLPFFPAQPTTNDESDIRHLASVIGAGIQYLVTRDGRLLDQADHIYERYQVRIVRPAELVIHFDELLRESVYQPVRLAGTAIVSQPVAQGQVGELIETFQNSGQGETPAKFRAAVRRFLAAPRAYENAIIRDDDHQPLAVLVTHHPEPQTCEVPLFRVASNAMKVTLARYLVFSCVAHAVDRACRYVYVTDPALPPLVTTILKEEGFHAGSRGWLKLALRGGMTRSVLANEVETALRTIPPDYAGLREVPSALDQLAATPDTSAFLALERLLWPVKIVDADIPTFIMPIRPVWAQRLFDESLARQSLFGVDAELALRRECVFYRAKRPTGGLKAPARVLWYVSQDGKHEGAGAIRACSHIDEVVIGSAKPLFRQFRRLGAYDWKRLLQTAHGDHEKQLMAVRFRDTELLPSPVRWGATLRQVVPRHANFQSPVRITPAMFAALYEMGHRLAGRS